MKQFRTIFAFEFNKYLKNKVFVGVTLFLVIAIALVMFIPRFANLSGSDGDPSAVAAEGVMLIRSDSEEFTKVVESVFPSYFPRYAVSVADGDLDWMREQVESQKALCAFDIDSKNLKFTYYVRDMSMYDDNQSVAAEALTKTLMADQLIKQGVDREEVVGVLSREFTGTAEVLGTSQFENFFYTYIMMFALYMVILLYGQLVATNVASEKASRAMELLVTTAKPTSMMFGKVLSSCLAGLTQLVLVFGSAIVFYKINESYWGDNMIISSIFNMSPALFGYMLLFFVLGFLIYAFLYGAIGSTASKLEDINTSVMPLTFVIIIAFMVVMFSISSGNMDNPALIVCSFIPFTSPMAMFTRIAMSQVPVHEIIISVALLAASVVGVGWISAKIYRVGVLLYGTPPKLSAIIKAVRNA